MGEEGRGEKGRRRREGLRWKVGGGRRRGGGKARRKGGEARRREGEKRRRGRMIDNAYSNFPQWKQRRIWRWRIFCGQSQRGNGGLLDLGSLRA